MILLQNLPERHKRYTMVRRDKRTYDMDGELRERILNSKTQMIVLPDGSVWNKADIVGIDFIKSDTKDALLRLPEAERKKLLEPVNLPLDKALKVY